MDKKFIYLMGFFALILLGIIIAIGVVTITGGPSSITVTPTPSPMPTPLPAIQSNPPVLYDKDDQRKLLDKINTRTSLEADELAAKQKILSNLPSGAVSGVVYRSANIIIDYTHSIDLFQVEIQTTDIDGAKDEAMKWFALQGFTKDSVCKAPVQFYLSSNIADSLRDKDVVFSPLGPGCE